MTMVADSRCNRSNLLRCRAVHLHVPTCDERKMHGGEQPERRRKFVSGSRPWSCAGPIRVDTSAAFDKYDSGTYASLDEAGRLEDVSNSCQATISTDVQWAQPESVREGAGPRSEDPVDVGAREASSTQQALHCGKANALRVGAFQP